MWSRSAREAVAKRLEVPQLKAASYAWDGASVDAASASASPKIRRRLDDIRRRFRGRRSAIVRRETGKSCAAKRDLTVRRDFVADRVLSADRDSTPIECADASVAQNGQ